MCEEVKNCRTQGDRETAHFRCRHMTGDRRPAISGGFNGTVPDMIDAVSTSYRQILVRWVDLVRRSSLAVVLGAIMATIGVGYYVASTITINTDTADLLAHDLPYRRDAKALKEAFPQFTDNLLVVIDAAAPDLADDAALVLARRLRDRPELFGDVYDLAGDPTIRRNSLLYLDIKELSDLGDRLAEAQPFLAKLWSNRSLKGLFDMLGLAIEQALDADGAPPIELDVILNAASEVAEKQAAGRFAVLSWQEMMRGKKTGSDEGRRFLLIQPVLDFGSFQPAAHAIDGIRELAVELKLDLAHGIRVRLTGSAALAQEELKSVEQGMGLAAALSLSLVILLLLVGMRSVPLAGAVLLTLIMGLVWTAVFATLAIGQLNLISVAFAVLFIGLSVDFGIHFGLRYREAIDRGEENAAALSEAAEKVGGALTLCAVAAAIGFFSFMPTDYTGLAELGLIAGAGMFIALFANITILPALLALGSPARPSAARRGVSPLAWLAGARGRGRAVVVGALVLALAAASLVPQARFDFNPLHLKDPKTESVSTLFDLMEDGSTSPYVITVLAQDLVTAAALAKRISRLDEVDEAVTLDDYVPGDQEDKLAIIEDMALFLSPSLAVPPRTSRPDGAERRAALDAFKPKLARYSNAARDDKTRAAAGRFMAALDALAGGASGSAPALEVLEARLTSTLPNRLDVLRRSLEAAPMMLEDLPVGLRERNVAADGRTKISVYPKVGNPNREQLKQFVGAVRSIAPRATGSPVVIFESGTIVVAAFRDAALIALGAIALMLAVLLRRARDVILVFAPLALAALLTVAASVLFDLPFNFANVIVLPLLFGLGVANGIHLVLRERGEAGVGAVLETSTLRAVTLSALTTVGSFGSLALSGHLGTSSMGLLLTIAITFNLVCTLVVLPALMAVWPSVRRGNPVT